MLIIIALFCEIIKTTAWYWYNFFKIFRYFWYQRKLGILFPLYENVNSYFKFIIFIRWYMTYNFFCIRDPRSGYLMYNGSIEFYRTLYKHTEYLEGNLPILFICMTGSFVVSYEHRRCLIGKVLCRISLWNPFSLTGTGNPR